MLSSRTIISFLFLAAASIVFLTWTRPCLNEVSALRAQKESFDEALDNSRELREMRDELLAEYNSISSEDLQRLSKILPEKPEITKLMVGLANIAQTNGIVINQLIIQEKEETGAELMPPKYKEVLFDISFRASYEGVRVFIEELQKSLRLMDIEQINFLSKGANSYEFTISAKTYFKR